MFVDSACSDGSAAVAAGLGVEHLSAPLGKGRAMAVARDRCQTEHICFLDADIEPTSDNLALALRRALEEEPADMILGDIDWPGPKLRVHTRVIYRPLMEALFPELVDAFGHYQFTGFRTLRVEAFPGPWPIGYGVETHLNLVAATSGLHYRVIAAGEYHGPWRAQPEMGRQVGAAVLDAAVREGRLAPECRPAWDDWIESGIAVLRTQTDLLGRENGFAERLAEAAARPLPS